MFGFLFLYVYMYAQCLVMRCVDFGDPLVLPSGGVSTSQTAFVANEEYVANIMGMGFSRDHAIKALKSTVSILALHGLVTLSRGQGTQFDDH